MSETVTPHLANEKHLIYLDALSKKGQINMYGAAPHLAAEFKIPVNDARKIVTYWMDTYPERHPEEV